MELSRVFLGSQANVTSDGVLPEPSKQGLSKTHWPGRCQTVQDPTYPKTTWFLDRAHTRESLEYSIKWFVSPDTVLREMYVSVPFPDAKGSTMD